MDQSQTWSNGTRDKKFALYSQYLQNAIAATSNLEDHSILQGKFTKLIGATVLQQYTLFTYVLAEAKHVSLTTQKQNIN